MAGKKEIDFMVSKATKKEQQVEKEVPKETQPKREVGTKFFNSPEWIGLLEKFSLNVKKEDEGKILSRVEILKNSWTCLLFRTSISKISIIKKARGGRMTVFIIKDKNSEEKLDEQFYQLNIDEHNPEEIIIERYSVDEDSGDYLDGKVLTLEEIANELGEVY